MTDPVYVAVWPYTIESHRPMCKVRPVCRLCSWKGKTRTTERVLHPDRSPEGIQAEKEGRRHLRNHHNGHR